jgi:inosose dehydratase
MLTADRVLSEMQALGIRATELGAPGFLPSEPDPLRQILSEHDMRLVGAFVPLVLHDATARERALEVAHATAALLQEAGASTFVSAAVVDDGWSPRVPLGDADWAHLVGMLDVLDELVAGYGLAHAFHPHVGTLVETAADVRVVLERSAVRWCLDTGHLLIGGYDPLQFAIDAAGRVAHVHLKDVRAGLAAQVRSGDLSLMHAVQQGLFCPLGRGDAPIREVVATLEGSGYQQWYVLEQDTAVMGDEPPPGTGPVDDVRESLGYLRLVISGELAG